MKTKIRNINKKNPLHVYLLTTFIIIFLWSAFKPVQFGTWLLEVTPIFLGAILIVLLYNKFRLTTPIYVLLLLGSVIVLIGGHYTYGNVPVFNWFNYTFNLGRNYYDRFGHLISGGVWALTIREILLRKTSLKKGKILVTIVLGLEMAVSTLYELAEWLVALIMGSGAEAFLGLQGDIWDTQWDMFLALIGAVICLIFLTSIHNRYLAKEIGLK